MTPITLRDEMLHHLRGQLEFPARASLVYRSADDPGVPAIEVETDAGPVTIGFFFGDRSRPCTAEEEAQLEQENDW